MEFRSHTLDNGLQIVAECNPQAYSTAVAFFVRTGARDETDAVSGVSHFLEHMAFKGTAARSADDVNRQFDELGADYNARTGEEFTIYYAAVLPEYQTAVVELWSDILRPSLRKEDFDTEKQVILEEIRMYEDQPPFGADEKIRAAYFDGHPLGRSVLGSPESIRQLSVDAMRDYFERRYSPTNVVLAGAGRIDFDALVATARKCCGHWKPLMARREVRPVSGQVGFHRLHRESATQQYSLQLAAGPSANDPSRYAAKLLSTVLADDSGSRLFWELIDPGLAEQVAMSHEDYEGAGAFFTYLSCEPDRTADNLRRILDVYRQAQRDGVTPAELDQAKSKVRSRVVLSSERPVGRLFNVGLDWVQRGRYRAMADDLDTLARITVDDIAQVLRQYPLTRSMTLSIGPLTELAEPK